MCNSPVLIYIFNNILSIFNNEYTLLLYYYIIVYSKALKKIKHNNYIYLIGYF